MFVVPFSTVNCKPGKLKLIQIKKDHHMTVTWEHTYVCMLEAPPASEKNTLIHTNITTLSSDERKRDSYI